MAYEQGSISSSNLEGSPRVAQNRRFLRKKGGARELLAKEKKGLFLGQGIFFGWRRKGKGKGFIMQMALLPLEGRGGPGDYLIGATKKIPNWLVKITFLVKAETAIWSGIKSKFGIMALTQVIPFGACGFSL